MVSFVTGAGGFIGSHLTEALLRTGHNVKALVHYNSRGEWGHLDSIDPDLKSGLEVILGDVTDTYLMQKAVRGCDTVFHLAALIGIPYSYSAPASYVSTNVNGTLNILEACRSAEVERVLITSTSEVYGTACYTPIDESHPLQAQSPYAASKIAADKLGESYFLSFGLPVTVVRPFNTYGPRQSSRAVIPTIASQLVAGAQMIKLGSLWPERDLTFVEDTVAGFIELAKCSNAIGEVVNLGNGKKISVGDLAKNLIKLSGREAQIISSEERLRPENSEVGLLLANTDKVRSLTKWTPRVSLEEGLTRVLSYIESNIGKYRPGDYQR